MEYSEMKEEVIIMTMDFQNSKTKENLMRAFAGESQARNRYTFAAEQAQTANLRILAEIFKFTADQERAHAKVFYDHLTQLAGQTVAVDGTYPIDIADNLLELLHMAHHNELEEFESVYPAFAQVAQEEGYPKVAASFEMIAQIEQSHGKRFAHMAQLMEQNQLFAASGEEVWMCLNCGHLHRGKQVPAMCPVCSHNQGFFIKLDMAPWTC